MKINWETELQDALEKAEKEGRAVLLDFFNPG